MLVAPTGDQYLKQWVRLHINNSSGAKNLELMQVAPFLGQIWKQCEWRNLVAKFGTISKWRQPVTKFVNSVSYANWWPNYGSGAAPSVV